MNLNTLIYQPLKNYLNSIRRYHFLKTLKRLAKTSQGSRSGEVSFYGLNVAYNNIASLYTEYKNIFLNRIYHFEAETSTPYILDGGGHIGLSVLYFKFVYPKARIICFEPDKNIFRMLHNNITRNKLDNVEIVQAGLAREVGTAAFLSDGADGGKVDNEQNGRLTIKTVRLSEYLTSPVDFLKLNIEGQELPVLMEAEKSGKLSNVREMVIEYHGWAGEKQQLGALLELLDRNNFEYLIHDFDRETCPMSKPPFVWTPQTTWYCLVYAKQHEA